MSDYETGKIVIEAPRPEEDAASSYAETVEARMVSEEEAAFQSLLSDPANKSEKPSPSKPSASKPSPQEADDNGWIDTVKGAFSDLGQGVIEAPGQVAGGIADAFDEAGQFLGEATGIGGFQFTNDEGEFEFDYLNFEEWEAAGKQDSLTGLFKTDPADTKTGSFIRATSQFLTGFIPAMKGAKAAGIGNNVLRAMSAGAVADAVVFDPHEARLSTFLNEIPALDPFVSDYFADNNPENESSWEGRLKNVVEGAGLGLAADGTAALFRAFKYYKAQRNTMASLAPDAAPGAQREAAKDLIDDAARNELVQDVPDEALRPLGDPDGDLLIWEDGPSSKMEEALEQAGQRAAASPAGPPQKSIKINHARIQSGDDVKAMIEDLAQRDAPAIKKKTRGKVSNEQTIRESSQEYRDLDDLIGRPPGPMTAAQATAARRLLTASGEQIADLAKRAAAPDASKADIYNFRRAMSVHYAIQSEVIAARTETARALQAWSIPAGSTKARSQAINDLITQSGGAGDLQSLAKAVASVGENPAALNTMARELGKGKFGRALYQVWINGILSSPKTHAVNIMSNAMVSIYSIPERYMAAGISKAFYNGEVTTGEAAAQVFGLMKGARDGLRLIWHGNKAEGMDGIGDVFDAFAKQEIHVSDISSEAFGLKPGGVVGQGLDYLGKIVNIPGSLLAQEDKFFKSIGYRMELHSLAHRTAASEGLEGEAMAKRIADILSDPPSSLKAEAMDVAHYNTFTNELGKIGNKFTQGVNAIPGARLVVPFIRTPTNIIKYTFARTPLAYMSGAIRADIKAGGARAAQAHARVALGSMMMMTVADMTMEETITGRGPTDARMRKVKMDTGWMPYSVKVGDRWYQYSRTDPIGMIMGIGADMAELMSNANNEEAEFMVTAGVLALANNLANKTYMTGIYDFIGAIDPNNPTNDPGRYLADFAGSMVPFSSFLRNVASTADPIARETRTAIYDQEGDEDPVAAYVEGLIADVRAQIPGMGQDLPPRRDLFGEEINRASGLGWGYDFISPLSSRVDDPDPVTSVILDNQITISNPPRSINGVSLNAEEYSEFTRIAGQPLKKHLDQLVKSPAFKRMSGGPDGMKSQMIKDAVRMFRDSAKAQMMRDYPRLQELYQLRELERARTLQGDEQ